MTETIQDNKLTAFVENLSATKIALSQALLNEATEVLSANDFPTTRTEAWKYTRVGRIAGIKGKQQENSSALSQQKALSKEYIFDENALTFVFENGNFVPEISSLIIPQGLTIKSFSNCTSEELSIAGSQLRLEKEVFNALNTAYLSDGLFIQIADNVVLENSIQIVHILSGEQSVSNFRCFIQSGKFSKAHIMQGYFSSDANSSFANVVTEISIGEGSQLTIDKLQYESAGNFHVSTEEVSQAKNSTFTINTMTLNGTLVRNNLNIAVNGVNCNTHLNGAYLLKENQHVDNHTVVDHKAPHCESFELYKGVMDDKSTGVFNGKVFVRQDSQKINAFQSNANVLLSDDATINSKPELEIYADDVKCSHGSTTGQLDEEAIFYLRARGISEKSARHLMVSAFIGDVVEKIENKAFLQKIHSIMNERFGWEF